MLLRAGLGPGKRLAGPRVACLTGFQTPMAFSLPDDFYHRGPRALVLPHCLGAQAQPVGRVVLAAVPHHTDFEPSRQIPSRMPIRLPNVGVHGSPFERAVFLRLANEVPPGIPNALAPLLRRIPRVKEDKLQLALEPVVGLAPPLSGPGVFRRAAFGPHAKGARHPDLPVRPDEEHDGDPEHDLALLARPHPRGFPNRRASGCSTTVSSTIR